MIRLFFIILFFSAFDSFIKGQEDPHNSHQPIPVYTLSHPQRLAKALIPNHSFYKSKADWQYIIDTTWGPGLPLTNKLEIFDAYATAITNKFDGFLSIGLNWNSWDSLKNKFRSRIDSLTSRGRFASIMAQFAMSLRDGHTWAWDTVVIFTPLSPGVPILVLDPFVLADHFGAVLTALPDSTALVLRTVPNHPLGLQPGDIVLGYEGVPWKYIVRQLLDAELPVYSIGVGVASAEIHSFIRNAGNNWHLFETIDILKHSTHDTLHLSVQPLLNLPSDPMMGNEQLEIPGIPFSFYRGYPWGIGKPLAFGKLPSVNVGYIRLLGEWPSLAADPLFKTAVDSLWDSDGLIIDLRWNPGGWSTFDQAFARMFSQRIYTINDLYRSSSSSFYLAPAAHSGWFLIPGVQGSIYDRPIAVILGPTCASLGDITAHRLRYHPMARFFGKAPIACFGDNVSLTSYKDWWLNYSISDMYHLSEPGIYLNRSEFPLDELVWFNPDDVSKGIDPIVEKALHWMYTLSYSHDLTLSEDTIRNVADSIYITAKVENPESHTLVVSVIVTDAQGSIVDSIILQPFSGDSLWATFISAPITSGWHYLTLRTDDVTSGTYRRLSDAAKFRVVLTGVEDLAGDPPRYFNLYQNFPNPFNPITKISWQLAVGSKATIKVYDILGREIKTLVNEYKPAGRYEIEFEAGNLPSGVYFYGLRAGEFSAVKKMLLIK